MLPNDVNKTVQAEQEKPAYERPVLKEFGTLQDFTAVVGNGGLTDGGAKGSGSTKTWVK